MSAVEALQLAEQAGITVVADRGTLRVRSKKPAPTDIVERLRRNKPEIIALLTAAETVAAVRRASVPKDGDICRTPPDGDRVTTPAPGDSAVPPRSHLSTPDDFEERAAVVEYGVGVPREWAEGFARLNLAYPPRGFTQVEWELVIDDGGRFLDRWAAHAAQAGWTALDVFGVHPRAPTARYDAMGLVPLIRGGEVIAIRPDRAVIQSHGGNCLTYYLRREAHEAVTLWSLSPFHGSPIA